MNKQENKIRQLEQKLSELEQQVKQTAIYQAEKDRLEAEYQQSQVRFRTVFEESAIGKKIINDQLQIIKVNKALLKILGYSEKDMLGRLITEFAEPDFVPHWKRLQQELWTTAMSSFNFDTCLIGKDGLLVWVHVTTILIDDNGGRLGYTIIEDISERKELERLRDLVREQEQRQQIAEAILNSQEDERRRVGEGLHNGLGQLLYGVKLSLSQLQGMPGKEQAFNYTHDLITEAIVECRRISHDQMPATLAEYGLQAAIEESCIQLSGETHFTCHAHRLKERLPDFLEVAIYRIIQELMLNVVKHAGASEAQVSLASDQGIIHMRIIDNGRGFDEQAKTTGIGLRAIAYKVGLLSGNVNIASEKGKGTHIRISIPRRVD